MEQIANILAEFPEENYATAKYLFQFLSIVAKHEEKNKMTITNLATVFGPNLLSSPEGNTVRAFGIVNALTETIIQFHAEIFKVKANNPKSPHSFLLTFSFLFILAC